MRKLYQHKCRRCRKIYQHRDRNHEFCSYICYAQYAKTHGWWNKSRVAPESAAVRVEKVNAAVQKAARKLRQRTE